MPGRPHLIQPGQREWVTTIECIGSTGFSVPTCIIFKGSEIRLFVVRRLANLHDEQVLLIVVLGEGRQDEASQNTIAAVLREGSSPRQVPKPILQVADIPYTFNGKKIEGLVRDVVSRKPVTPSAVVANI
ncbi:hypothetical protein BDV12DRAFT_203478 [Aspergillus spectabilis]